MDRFIEPTFSYLIPPLQHLKSNMDRFIETTNKLQTFIYKDLKSNMDRFIVIIQKNLLSNTEI